jgi:hemolysin III
MSDEHPESFREEVANALTHGLGVVGAIAGGAVLITLAALYSDGWQLASAIVFISTLVLLYTASTLYHAIPHEPTKTRLQILDHMAIYLLIAGTYTPFTLVGLKGPWGWWLFGTIWTLAILGVAFKAFYTGRFKRLSTVIYVAMGWIAVVAIEPMIRMISAASLLWLLAGGVFYTLGTVFYMSRRRYAHAIWHAFVLGGSISHFVAVWLLVVEPASAG